jgi:RNA polymerase sigma-70 factor (ECF subfamily)
VAATTDSGLVRRLRAREPAAWDEVYRLYGDRLYGFAYRLSGSPHDAADLVQETFVRALPRLDTLQPAELDLAAYLFTTTRNLFLKDVERRKRARPVPSLTSTRRWSSTRRGARSSSSSNARCA